MAYRYEAEVTISSAKDVKNVNWRHGPTRPYAVVWIDPTVKRTTRSDDDGDTSPHWDETLVLPVPPLPLEDATLHVDLVHAGSEEDTKRFIGSARLRLMDVVDEVGYGDRFSKSLPIKRSSGRPQGRIEVRVSVREQGYRPPDPYAVPPPATTRDVYGGAPAPAPYGYPYGGLPPSNPFYASAPPSAYQYDGGAPPPQAYGQPAGYGYEGGEERRNRSGMGMGTGVALGVAGGALGAVALIEGEELVEESFDNAVEEAVDDALGF